MIIIVINIYYSEISGLIRGDKACICVADDRPDQLRQCLPSHRPEIELS